MVVPVPATTPDVVAQETVGVEEQFVELTIAVKLPPRAPNTSTDTVGGGGGVTGVSEPPPPQPTNTEPKPTALSDIASCFKRAAGKLDLLFIC